MEEVTGRAEVAHTRIEEINRQMERGNALVCIMCSGLLFCAFSPYCISEWVLCRAEQTRKSLRVIIFYVAMVLILAALAIGIWQVVVHYR